MAKRLVGWPKLAQEMGMHYEPPCPQADIQAHTFETGIPHHYFYLSDAVAVCSAGWQHTAQEEYREKVA